MTTPTTSGGPGRPYALLLLCFLLVYILPLGQRPLFEPDETRYAEIPREMADGGNWLELRLAGLRYYEKPPLGYWLGAASISLFGHHPLAARLPAALAAGASALAIFLMLRAHRSDPSKALGAAVIYLSFVQVFGIGTFATLDSLFSFFVTLSLCAFFLATESPPGLPRMARLLLAGSSCAAAFLTKGFTALAIPMLSLAIWLPWQRLLGKHLVSCLTTLLFAILAALPTALVLHTHNPEFWNYFFWVEHVQRFLGPSGGQHKEPFWYYLPVLAAGALPWTFFLPYASKRILDKIRTRDSLSRYCLTWFVIPLLFFSACGGKIATYILPCFAPLAILLTEAIFDAPTDFSRAAKTCALFFCALVPATIVFGPLFLDNPLLLEELKRDPRTWLAATGIILAAAGFYQAASHLRASSSRLAALARYALPCLLLFLVPFYGLPSIIIQRKSPSVLLEEAVSLTPPEAFILTDRPSLVASSWHYRRNDLIFALGRGELAYGLQWPEAQGRCLGSETEVMELIHEQMESGRPVAVVMDHYSRMSRILTPFLDRLNPARILQQGDFSWRLYLP